MNSNLWRRYILPFIILVGALGAAAIAGDAVLHSLNLVWIGRYLGIPGTLLIVASLTYSLRKRNKLSGGKVTDWLRFHEAGGWLGSLMVLLHSGVHFNAILPWFATIAMGVNVISGMVGKILLARTREHVSLQREKFRLRGMSKQEVDRAVFWDALAVTAMTQWRKLHIPIFVVFASLSLAHIVTILLFWGWK